MYQLMFSDHDAGRSSRRGSSIGSSRVQLSNGGSRVLVDSESVDFTITQIPFICNHSRK